MRADRRKFLFAGAATSVAPFLAPTPRSQPAPKPPTQDQLLRQLTDFAELKRYAAENAALPPAPNNRVVFMGDSLTDSWGRKYGQFFPGKPYVNRGISGQTTQQMLIRFRQDVIDLKPALVVILAGTNDIAGNTGPSTLGMIEDNLQSMVDLARANGIRVVLSSVLPATVFHWKPDMQPAAKIRELNAWIASYSAKHHMVYLDYYSALTDANGGMKAGTNIDGVHPNNNGYAIMQPLAESAIAKAMRKH